MVWQRTKHVALLDITRFAADSVYGSGGLAWFGFEFTEHGVLVDSSQTFSKQILPIPIPPVFCMRGPGLVFRSFGRTNKLSQRGRPTPLCSTASRPEQN